MTELDDMKEEAKHIQKSWMNVNKLRKALQQRAIKKMARGENVKEMLEIIQITKQETEEY